MKWYKVTLLNFELSKQLDRKIIGDFIRFLIKQGSPPGLAMYTSTTENITLGEMHYYFSSPEELSILFNECLTGFHLREIPEPKINSLHTILGSFI
ncbi:MAG TPA: hypothetical protein PL018_15585 [Ignavibacteriaceae bacterium]|nr:hypothetical protein [Ignavibacterium sp.]HMN25520.1 hypothetical protein [Ignavibacteriaceae bacterium]HRN27470.1 hypothetical protein [Ignavibacteriaceae bacterium]HRP94364.1 hypothetical protein [Ignavibacteriaceae bacterium]HRQ55679.1 hypothetical protein [Ignavibacteriaceae bacterium]